MRRLRDKLVIYSSCNIPKCGEHWKAVARRVCDGEERLLPGEREQGSVIEHEGVLRGFHTIISRRHVRTY